MKHHFPLLILALLCAISCSEQIEAEGSAVLPNGKVRVTISGTQTNTRTSLDPDGRTTRWSIGDQIAIWAKTDSEYALDSEPFKLYTYNGLFSSADFSTTITTPMAQGTYTYYAVYPLPTSRTGTQVSYELPAVQNGTYDGSSDILISTPVTGPQLAENPRDELVLAFRHLLHMIRIEIPKGRNLFGEPVKKLEITFPTEVSGTVSFDITDPDNTLAFTNGSRTLTLEFPGAGLTDTEGVYAYAFVRPCEVNGQITFRAYNAAGYQAKTISTTLSNRTFRAGHTTPIAVTIPEARPITYLDFKVASNNLGEDLTAIHLTASGDARFVVPFSAESSASVSAIANSGLFRTVLYADECSGSTLASQQFAIAYESANALVSNQSILLPAAITDNTSNNVQMDIPFLYDEDFSSVTTFSKNDNNTTDMTRVGSSNAENISPSGWTGARVGAEAGKALRICCRGEQAVLVPGSYNGRADSPNMDNLKEGNSVKLRITFNYSLNRKSSKNSANQHYFALNMHTNAGLQNATRGGVRKLGSDIADNTDIRDLYGLNDGSFDNIYKSADYTFNNCTKASRFVWEAYIKTKCPDGYYNNWVYLDNIKVQIVK